MDDADPRDVVPQRVTCLWKAISGVNYTFRTECEWYFSIHDRPIGSNGYRYCPKCRKEIREVNR